MGNSTFSQFQIVPTAYDANAVNAAMKRMLDETNSTLEEIGFNSQEEFRKALANPKYEAVGAEGEAYRRLVARMVQNSRHDWKDVSHNEQAATQRRSDWKAEEDRAILREHVQSLMSDPRYESSTLFRKQVREQIEANPHLFEQGMPTGTRITGRVQMDGDDFNAVRAGLAKEKQDKREAEAKAAADRAAKLAAMESYDITKPFGMDDAE